MICLNPHFSRQTYKHRDPKVLKFTRWLKYLFIYLFTVYILPLFQSLQRLMLIGTTHTKLQVMRKSQQKNLRIDVQGRAVFGWTLKKFN
jgi:hypothetical protein